LSRTVENTLIANTTFAGTLLYMSLELLTEKEWGISTDIRSLGYILYQMMSGKLPFYQKDLQSLIQMILTLSPEPLPEQYSDKLRHFVHFLLIVDPELRIAAKKILKDSIVLKFMKENPQILSNS
jgi:serine/threonine protein kinase